METTHQFDNSCKEEFAFSDAKSLSSIVCGSAFFFLAFWMIFANTAKIAVARKADLQQRLTIAVTICTGVALFSGFFNILQLTKIQQVALPRPTQFTVDIARPVEWIFTCPILQLSLVILGGTRLPSYRRFMMPLLSVAILLCGTASMFTESAIRWAWYALGFILMVILFYHNIIQIRENSDGAETLYRGSSDFRWLTILLLALWFPFPFWFFLSPEGIGVVTDILVINLGWAVLNIVSKFSFIVYLQLAKSRYTAKKEAAQELYAVQPAGDHVPERTEAWLAVEGPPASAQFDANVFPPMGYSMPRSQMSEKLAVLVTEAMVTLGLSQHSERFLALLEDQGVTSLDALEKLNQDRCMDLGLPWNLVQATQRRWISEKMTLADELDGQDAADLPGLAPSAPQRGASVDQVQKAGQMAYQQAMPAYQQAMPAHMLGQGHPGMLARSASDDRLNTIESMLHRLLEKVDSSREAVLAKVSTSAYGGDGKPEPAEFMHIGERLAVMMQKQEHIRDDLARHIVRVKDEIQQSLAQELRGVAAQVEASRAEMNEQLRRSVDVAKDELMDKVSTSKVDVLEKVSAAEEHLIQRVVLVGQNVELSKEVFLQRASSQDGAMMKLDGWKQELLGQLEVANEQVAQKMVIGLQQAQEMKEQVVLAIQRTQQNLQRAIEETRVELSQKADLSEEGSATTKKDAESKLTLLVSKIDEYQDALLRSQGDVDTRIASFLSKVQGDTEKHQRNFAERLGELLDKLLRAQEDHMIDIRRMNMMVMENVNAAQDRAQAGIDAVATRVSTLLPIRESGSRSGLSVGRHDEDASDAASVAASLGRGYMDQLGAFSQDQ